MRPMFRVVSFTTNARKQVCKLDRGHAGRYDIHKSRRVTVNNHSQPKRHGDLRVSDRNRLTVSLKHVCTWAAGRNGVQANQPKSYF